jgi:hypothetical protein
MRDQHIYSSKEILAMDDLSDLQELDNIIYSMTQDEMIWLDFVTGKYSIADYLNDNLDGENVTISQLDLSIALDYDCDGHGMAVMLSEDTALQKICFWLYADDIADIV